MERREGNAAEVRLLHTFHVAMIRLFHQAEDDVLARRPFGPGGHDGDGDR